MVVRIPRGAWLIATPVTIVLLVAGTEAAQRPAEGRRTPARLSSAQAVESLGPGPLPLRPAAGEINDRPKAATLEDAIDQCVEVNRYRLKPVA